MKNLLLAGLVAIGGAAYAQKYQDMIQKGTYTVEQIEKSAEKHFDQVGRGRGTGYKQFQRWLYSAKKERTVDGVLVKQNDQMRTLRAFKKAQRAKNDLQTLGTTTSGNWQELGPTYWDATSGWNPGVGRITSIGIDESNLNHYIVGGPNSGVWKTTDNGSNWQNLTDDFQSVNVWSLEIDPNNSSVYYWGSAYGDMFKSTDGGSTWTELNFPGGSNIIRILINPNNSNELYAVSGNLYKSTNGGTSWSQVSGTNSGGYDVEFKPGDPTTVYYSSSNVYKSTNSGSSFSQVSGFGTGPKMMAVTADNPNVVYVVEASGGSFGGFYKSTNSGTSFSQLHNSSKNYFGYATDGSDNSGQAPRDMDVTVSPSDENEVHIAGINTWRSTNGGTTFDPTSDWTPTNVANKGLAYCHADVDILKYHGNILFVGTDGGIYTSTDEANTYVDRTSGIGAREFYRIGVSKTDPNVVTGGAQDNGTSVMRGTNREWKDWLGADGMEAFVDWNNPNNLYGTSQNGSMYKSTNQGNSRSGISKPSGSGAWVTPFEQDPQVANTIYVGFNEVWKSTTQGGNWQQISNFGGGSLDELKIAPTNNQYIYAADGSTLNVTKNGGTSWSTISPGGTINYIHVSPRDEERIVAVTSSNIYISTNAGSSWTNYTKDLPNVSYYCALWQDNSENGLYVGGNGFISYIEDGMSGYVTFDDGLANCRVYELDINYVSNKIFAGTYGRGLWESDIYGAQALDYDASVENITDVPSSICGSSVSPQVTIKNRGAITMTSVTIEVYLNNVLKETINHSTNLATGATEVVTLSGVTYTTEGNNTIKVVVKNPNGQTDEKSTNDEDSKSTSVAFGTEHKFYIAERSAKSSYLWEIKDGSTVVKSGSYGDASVNGNYLEQEVCLQAGCYDFVMSDAFTAGGCNTPAWNSSTVYLGDSGLGAGNGEVVSHNGKEWRAQWWTQGNEPGTNSVWVEVGDCNVVYPTDEYGFTEVGETEYFEVQEQDFSSSKTNAFCFGSSLSVDFSADVTTTTNCEDVVFTANITGGTPTSYSWDFGSGASPATATGVGPHTVRYLTAGDKSVSLTADATNESKSNYITISADAAKAVTASIALSNSPTCEGDLVELAATLGNEGSSPSYSWKKNGSEISTSSSLSASNFVDGDKITLEVTSDDECSLPDNVTSNEVTLSLTPLTTPTIQIAEGNGETWPICVDGAINLEAVVTGAGNSGTITWAIDGSDDGQGSSYEFSGTNGQKITAKLNSSLACLATNDVVSNEITAVVDLCTSTDEKDMVSLHFFPNPVIDVVTLEGSNIAEVYVTEITGKTVITQKVNSIVTKIDMSNVAAGNYLIKVVFNNGSEQIKEITRK